MTIKTLGYEIRPDRVCWPQCYHQEEHEPHQTDQRGINKKKQGPKRLAWSARKLLYVKSGVMGSPWDYELSIKIWTQKMDRTFKRQFLGLPRKIRWVRIPPPPQKKPTKMLMKKNRARQTPTLRFILIKGGKWHLLENELCLWFSIPPHLVFWWKKIGSKKLPHFFSSFPHLHLPQGFWIFFRRVSKTCPWK